MRDYDPTTGRYLQADPLGLIDGASVYGYARQSPGRWVDPRGESAVGDAWTSILCRIAPITCMTFIRQPGPQFCPMPGEPEALLPPVVMQEKTPNEGPPGSTHTYPGSGQVRKYGEDGKPIKDIDSGHDHGQGVPHAHDWGRDADGRPIRGPGRPLTGEE